MAGQAAVLSAKGLQRAWLGEGRGWAKGVTEQRAWLGKGRGWAKGVTGRLVTLDRGRDCGLAAGHAC